MTHKLSGHVSVLRTTHIAARKCPVLFETRLREGLGRPQRLTSQEPGARPVGEPSRGLRPRGSCSGWRDGFDVPEVTPP